MFSFPSDISFLPWISQTLGVVQQQFYVFLLVTFRLSGMMVAAPGFSHPAIPLNVRIFGLLTIALVLTPNLPSTTREVVAQWDTNQNGWLEPGELPDQLLPRMEALQWREMGNGHWGVPAESWQLVLGWPASLLDALWTVAGEFSLGLVLGVGAMLLISGLQLAGQLIDQQTGVGLGEVFNPQLDTPSSVSSEWLYWLGMTVLFLVGGHLFLLHTLLETFRVLPVGAGSVTVSAVELLSQLVHQSLRLALQVSAPVLATQTLIGLAMGFLGHTVPQINILVFGFPVRIFAGMLVLALVGSGAVENLIDTWHAALTGLGRSLTGAADG